MHHQPDPSLVDDATFAAQLHEEELRNLEESRYEPSSTPSRLPQRVQTSQPSASDVPITAIAVEESHEDDNLTTHHPHIDGHDQGGGGSFFVSHLVPIFEKTSEEEYYCGRISCAIGCCLFIVFWPAALFVPCFPCDKRTVTKRGYVVE